MLNQPTHKSYQCLELLRYLVFPVVFLCAGCSSSGTGSGTSSGSASAAASSSGGAGSGSGSSSGGSGSSSGGSGSSSGGATGTGAVCTAGWCWAAPLPTGDDLGPLWGADDNDLYVIAKSLSGDKLTHFDGSTWTLVLSADSLSDVFGISGSDVYAVGKDGGEAVIFHILNGSPGALRTGEPFKLTAVHATAPDDVWACGEEGALLHWDGHDWLLVPSGFAPDTCTSIFALSPTDVWIGTRDFSATSGRLCHYDGMVSRCDPVLGGPVTAVAAVGGRVLMGTEGNMAIAFDGGMPTGAAGCQGVLDAVTFADAGVVSFASAYGTCTWQDGTWSGASVSFTPLFSYVWGKDPQNLMLAGRHGELWRISGPNHNPINNTAPLTAALALGATDIWVGGQNGEVRHFDGVQWRTVRPAVQFAGAITALVGTSGSDVWVASSASLRHWDGAAFAAVLPDADAGLPVVSVNSGYAAGARDAWFSSATNAGLLHWNGDAITLLPLGMAFDAVDGTGPADIYALSTQGLWHFDGTNWLEVPGAPTRMTFLRAAAPDAVYLGGLEGLYRFDGQVFQKVYNGTVMDAAWDGTQLWLAQQGGVVQSALVDGGAFGQFSLASLNAISFAPDGTGVVVGDNGTILVRHP